MEDDFEDRPSNIDIKSRPIKSQRVDNEKKIPIKQWWKVEETFGQLRKVNLRVSVSRECTSFGSDSFSRYKEVDNSWPSYPKGYEDF